jgi:hypothetical protein
MWGLQFFVGRRLGLAAKADTTEKYARLGSADKAPVRNALFQHPELIDEYLALNPEGLSPDELAIVRGWKRFVSGDFVIERLLKKGAVFIGAHDPPNVYLVLGLHSAIEEIFPSYGAPYLVKAMLLPFRGRIVYDGLLESYQIIIGPGIKSSLREDYLRARQRGEIIEALSLPGDLPALDRQEAPGRGAGAKSDVGPALDEIVAAVEKLKATHSPVSSAALALLRASAHLAREAARDPQDLNALWEHEEKTRRALIRLEKTLNRAG